MTRTEALIHGHLVRVKALEAKIIAMRAYDARGQNFDQGFYTEEAYFSIAEQIEDAAQRIENLADDLTT